MRGSHLKLAGVCQTWALWRIEFGFAVPLPVTCCVFAGSTAECPGWKTATMLQNWCKLGRSYPPLKLITIPGL